MKKNKKKKLRDGVDKYLADGRKRGKILDHYKMLKDIDRLANSDFVAVMEMNLLPHSETGKLSIYTQKEAPEMSRLLSDIYMISHCITCYACQVKYLK